MASIKKRGDSYRITVSLGYDENGKQQRVYETYTPDASKSKREQEREVNLFAAEFEEKAKNGQLYNSNVRFEFYAKMAAGICRA